jgi:hypothetical protein
MKKLLYILTVLFIFHIYAHADIIRNTGVFDSRAEYIFENSNCFITDSSFVVPEESGRYTEYVPENFKINSPDSIVYEKSVRNYITSIASKPSIATTRKIKELIYHINGSEIIISDSPSNPIQFEGIGNDISFKKYDISIKNDERTVLKAEQISLQSLDLSSSKKTKPKLQSGVPTDKAIYSSYFGGSDFDLIRDTEVDSAGNTYIVGHTFSPDYYVKAAYDDTFAESEYEYSDIFITKLDSSLKRVIFSTFIGTKYSEFCECIAFDKDYNIVIGGSCRSYKTFPVTDNALFPEMSGNYDGYILKLNTAGDSLIYSTLFGGNLDDYIQDIKIDEEGNVHIAGYTKSTEGFPVTDNAFQKTNFGSFDGFMAKLNPNMSSLIFSGYVGGDQADYIQKIALDKTGKPYYCGQTFSPNFPNKSNISTSFQNENNSDLFILTLDKDSYSIEKSVLIGGSKSDEAFAIQFDRNAVLHLTGNTESADFPVTSDALQTVFNKKVQGSGLTDAIHLIYNPRDDAIVYSSFLGGAGFDYGLNLSIDTLNAVNICGYTTSLDFPVTKNAFQSELIDTNHTSDVFISRITDQGHLMSYSTYFGGSGNDVAHGIYASNEGIITVTGKTQSDDMPITINAWDKILDDESETEIFTLRIKPEINEVHTSADTVIICGKETVELKATAITEIDSFSYYWYPEATLNRSDSSVVTAFPEESTEYFVSLVADGVIIDVASVYVLVKPSPNTEILGSQFVYPDSINQYRVNPTSDTEYFWEISKGELLTEATGNEIEVRRGTERYGIITINGARDNGCSDTDSIEVYSNANPFSFNLDQSGEVMICKEDFVIIDAGEYWRYYWSDGTRSRYDTVNTSGIYYCHAVDSDTLWGYSDTLKITVAEIPGIPIYGKLILAQGDTTEYQIMTDSNYTYTWEIENGTILEGQGTDYAKIVWSTDSIAGKINLIAENSIGCVDTTVYEIFIGRIDAPDITVLNGATAICPGDYAVLDAGGGYIEYLWNTGETTQVIEVNKPMQYWCKVTDVNNNFHESDTVSVTLLPAPPIPQVYYNEIDKVLICLDLADEYAWFLIKEEGDTLMSTEKEFYYSLPGDYYLVVTNEEGCSSTSRDTNTVGIFDLPNNRDDNAATIEIIPNPNNGIFKIALSGSLELPPNLNISIYSESGKRVFSDEFSFFKSGNAEINMSENPPGVYAIVIFADNEIMSKRFIIIK